MEPKLYKKKVITKEYYELHDNDNDNGYVKMSTAPATNNWPVPGQVAQVSAAEFTKSIQDYFDEFNAKIGRMINETAGTEDGLSRAEEELFNDIWRISTLLRPYYSAEFCEKFLQSIRSVALSVLQSIALVRQGLDTRTLTDFRMNTIIVVDLGIILNNFNNIWNRIQVQEVWTRITNSWFQAVKAKHGKDNAAAERHLQDATTFIKSFASILAQGVIGQFPERFVISNPTA